METKPEILDTRLVAKSRLFGIESVHLRFSNGEEREFERLRTPPIAGVMCVPMLDNDTVVLIREYGAGVEDYQLTLPKGAYEHGEDWRDAANRELKEEAGYGARTLTHLKDMTLSPGYMGHTIRIALAEDLYEETLPGDEPEPLEVLTWKLSELDSLVARQDMTEARVIAALYMVKSLLSER
ncbi:MAG: ADP compounds hydrolase NudE [Alteromonadaceae bacterium]|uniref:ADP compounds hydrolase NudE n=1 Tax=unclassified Marinobacter TaxID=83889 RepID=UPI000C40AFCC|nr:ADP compounds hydrolase NudE [Marinobacter sp. BGYM27]MAA66852.1 ADP compounds hydrolase NudE [Alteromonadaceae bacterium]MBH84905.1 ADP compounds hydrolase NudE [Alteromonadaceae bacterium]MDG5501034.1 ADP compounds hydrolase NudE [Marinobacter sp. BGYM27]|tara:strand:+ start:10085 stop:10630 length:546 start_codon:yes stop_codon:yes gene_type:complete